jgi:hypothetical protein
MPALCLLARDEKRHLLEREELECARAAIDAVLNALPVADSSSPEWLIACLPVRGWSDRLTCRALSHFLQADGIPSFSSRRVPVRSDEPAPVKSSGLRAICLWSLDPVDVAGVSRRVAQVRALHPKMDIVLGLCASAQREVLRDDRLARDPNLHLVDSFAAAQSIARVLVGPSST